MNWRMTPDVDLLTNSEVAARFKVSNATVRRWADAGRITSFKTPTGRYRYSAAEVAELLASGAIPTQRGAA
jgi:excisionase family DNA binding protein